MVDMTNNLVIKCTCKVLKFNEIDKARMELIVGFMYIIIVAQLYMYLKDSHCRIYFDYLHHS